MKTQIENQLEQLALNRSHAFCYTCYLRAPSGTCVKCLSDDLMRELPSVGVEYGCDWIIKHILENELQAIDQDEAFEEFMREVYPETTQVGFLTLDTVSTMKDQDPIAWDMAKSEWIDSQIADEIFFSLHDGSSVYSTSDVEELIEKGGG